MLTPNVKPKLPIKIPKGLRNTSRMFGDPLFRLAAPQVTGIKEASGEDDKRATSYMQSGQDSGRIANSVSSTVYSRMREVE
ncbi:hypothetical protein JTB14_023833 [Gonioctena quinquepunctata]|nr:hypothetical protein JTB14_023833 [Gonioctena quinquepunctata]